MSESKTSPRRLEAIERQRQALELRKAGATHACIAHQLGYAGPSSAFKAIQSAMKRVLQEPAEEVRKIELERLDAMLAALWPQVLSGKLAAVDRALRVMERRSKLLGLDAPARVEAHVTSQLQNVVEQAGTLLDTHPEIGELLRGLAANKGD